MNGKLNITAEELLDAIEQAQMGEEDYEGVTRSELEEKLGWGAKKVLAKLKSGIKAGVIEPCYLRRENLHGEMCVVKGYRLIKRGLTADSPIV